MRWLGELRTLGVSVRRVFQCAGRVSAPGVSVRRDVNTTVCFASRVCVTVNRKKGNVSFWFGQ